MLESEFQLAKQTANSYSPAYLSRPTESDGNDDLQQSSEVSSSKPNLIASDALGPLLLEALDGFMLVINQKGIIEYTSENVSHYLKFKQVSPFACMVSQILSIF